MRKLLMLALIVVVLRGALPTLAADPADLTALASFYPADAPLYVGLRTDDGYIEALDGILGRIVAIPDLQVPPVNVSILLDQLALQIYPPDGTFAGNIRPWLGDFAAFGLIDVNAEVLNNDMDQPPMIIVLSITDQDAVADLLITALTESETNFTQQTGPDYINLAIDEATYGVIVIRQDALVVHIGETARELPLNGIPDDSLAAQPGFAESFSMLPGSDYNIAVYLDTPRFVEAAVETDPIAAQQLGTLGGMIQGAGPQVWGFTVLDGPTLTIDIAQGVGDMATMIPAFQPIDPAFAARIPATAPLVIHANNLGGNLAASFDQIEGALAAAGDGSDAMLEEALATFESVTGLNLLTDVFGWMTGDYALYLDLTPLASGGLSSLPVSFALLAEVTDPAAAAATVDGLTSGLEQTLARMMPPDTEEGMPAPTVTREDINGTPATVLSIPASLDTPFPIELVISANDSVFVLGTRAAAEIAFAADGGLAADAEFIRSQQWWLPDPIQVAYIGTEGLRPLTVFLMMFAPSSTEDGSNPVDQAEAALDIFSSSTITSAYDANGNYLARLVLTFSE